MSAVLGVFDRRGTELDDRALERMLAGLAALGTIREIARPAPGVTMAAVRHEWERAEWLCGPTLLCRSGEVLLASDASIYYRRALRDRLAASGVEPHSNEPGALILAAWRAWGDRCPEWLEGDFAFMVASPDGEVLCARDFSGRRPLFYAELGGTLVVASAVGAILAHPDCTRDLDLAVVGGAAANMPWACGSDTAYRAVRVVPMAGTLRWDGRVRVHRHWTPPEASASPTRFDAAAEELRELLAEAVSERLSAAGTSAVWMSGGRDSTALFAAGQLALRREGGARRLAPVSISYPPGDAGREDELIQAVADFWKAPVHWLPIDAIPMFERDAERAAQRDEPTTSPYESWNTALAAASSATGARVAFDGNGGDQLFGGTDIYLADLLARGHWLTLLRELRSKRHMARRRLVQMAVRPLLAQVPGVGRHYLLRALPAWIDPAFARRAALLERESAHLPPLRPGALSNGELRWVITIPVMGYMQGVLQHRFLPAGVLLRSPLMDRRIVQFALTRPREDRIAGRDSKRLLRASMRGLLPELVLAPRPFRTGVTLSYSRRSMQAELPRLYAELLVRPLVLAQLGVVDPVSLRQAVDAFTNRQGNEALRLDLFHTLQTELWLRAHWPNRR